MFVKDIKVLLKDVCEGLNLSLMFRIGSTEKIFGVGLNLKRFSQITSKK